MIPASSVCLLALGLSCAGAQADSASATHEPQPPAAVAEAPESLDALLEPIREKHNLPALAGSIVHAGRTVAIGAVGVRSLGLEEQVTVTDRWHVGSCTKAMTATLIALLVEEGKLAWDTTIGDGLPDLRDDIRPEWLDVTLEQLLSHRSGLPGDGKPDTEIFPQLRRLSGPMRQQRQRAVTLILGQEPAAPAGSRMQYANANYIVAGAIAEAATGKSWEELIKQRLFKPLGMKSTGFGAPGDSDSISQPRGHRGDTPVKPGPGADNPPVMGPAGTVHSTLEDWGKFIALHLAGARGESGSLKPETFHKLHTPPGEQGYALGWGVTERSWGGGQVLTHAGSNTMWFAVTWLAPQKDFAVLTVTNTGIDAGRAACDEAAWALIRDFLKLDDK